MYQTLVDIVVVLEPFEKLILAHLIRVGQQIIAIPRVLTSGIGYVDIV